MLVQFCYERRAKAEYVIAEYAGAVSGSRSNEFRSRRIINVQKKEREKLSMLSWSTQTLLTP